MRIDVDFIFLPSHSLVEAAVVADQAALARPSVWRTHRSDRAGLAHAQRDVEAAFWSWFQANLIYDEETKAQEAFRLACLRLGFSGCWSVLQTSVGGTVEELMEEGRAATKFLEGRR